MASKKRKRKAAKKASSGFFNPVTLIVFCSCALAVVGLAILFSASLPVYSNSPYRIIEKQFVWVIITLIVGIVTLKIDLEWVRKFIWLGYALCVIGLILVLVPGIGSNINGSRSWFRVGLVGIQPAEFAKLGLIFFIAHYFSVIRKKNGEFVKGFFMPCIGIGLVVGLILLQTDVGTALIISLVAFCLLYLAGVKLVYLLPSAFGGVGLAALAVSFDPERLSRLTAILDIESNKAGDGYQVYQALLAFGVGGVNGVGLGQGRQQFRSLPEAHNDFIAAVVGEELGLIATMSILALFVIIFVAGLFHLRKAPNTYQYLLAFGCLLTIIIQALVNLGVVTGIMPTTGLPLPFMSSGGSNLLTMGICVAILLNTSLSWKAPALSEEGRRLKEIHA